MRILITGGSGLLAVNWAMAQKNKDEIWLGLHHRSIVIQNVTTIMAELDSHQSFCRTVEHVKPDLIIHSAAFTDVKGCEFNQAKAWQVNAVFAKNVAQVAHQKSIKLIHISTDHLFNGTKPLMTEIDPPEPVNWYGASKLGGEQLVTENNPEALILRINFFGWGPNYRQSFSDWILNSLKRERQFPLYDDVIFCPLYVTEIIEGANQLLDINASGVFHLVNSEAISKYGFGLKLAQAFDLDKSMIQRALYNESATPARPLDMSLNNTKFMASVGDKKPTFTIDKSIKKMLKDTKIKKLVRELNS